jgi:hypothetical protein
MLGRESTKWEFGVQLIEKFRKVAYLKGIIDSIKELILWTKESIATV